MDAKEKELLRRAKIAVGLTPAQADTVIEAQEAWDADPANPNFEKPSKTGKAEEAKDPAKDL